MELCFLMDLLSCWEKAQSLNPGYWVAQQPLVFLAYFPQWGISALQMSCSEGRWGNSLLTYCDWV